MKKSKQIFKRLRLWKEDVFKNEVNKLNRLFWKRKLRKEIDE